MPQQTLDLYLLTPRSSNTKTGKIPVSMSNSATCPPTCRLKSGCYACYGKLSLAWIKLDEGNLPNQLFWSDFCQKVKTLDCNIWRHNQAGDLPGRNNRLHKDKCLQLARANVAEGRNRGGYTYTHYPVTETEGVAPEVIQHNREVIAEMNRLGFAVNLSADSLQQADEMQKLGIGPVVTVLHENASGTIKTPAGRRVKICPAVVNKDVDCVDCKVCNVQKRSVIIGFPAHGTAKRRINEIVEKLTNQ